MSKPTPAQHRALEAIGAGLVSYSELAAHAAGYSPWRAPREVRRDTLDRVVASGWARRGEPAELTDQGRRALDPASDSEASS